MRLQKLVVVLGLLLCPKNCGLRQKVGDVDAESDPRQRLPNLQRQKTVDESTSAMMTSEDDPRKRHRPAQMRHRVERGVQPVCWRILLRVKWVDPENNRDDNDNRCDPHSGAKVFWKFHFAVIFQVQNVSQENSGQIRTHVRIEGNVNVQVESIVSFISAVKIE